MIRYYKTTDANVLAANEKVRAAREAFNAQCREIGEQFDGKPVFRQSVDGTGFAGLTLNNYLERQDRNLWTKPNKDYGYSYPRMMAVKGTRPEHKALREKYYAMKPLPVSNDPIWEAMKVNAGELLLSGVHLFYLEGTIYLGTTASVGPMMTEILGSEFNDAYAKHNRSKEGA